LICCPEDVAEGDLRPPTSPPLSTDVHRGKNIFFPRSRDHVGERRLKSMIGPGPESAAIAVQRPADRGWTHLSLILMKAMHPCREHDGESSHPARRHCFSSRVQSSVQML
jgi:hypothetical protein